MPALLVGGWLVAAYPLARAGHATPLPTMLLATAVIGGLLLAARRLPPIPDTPMWTVLATVGVSVAFGLISAARHAEPVVLRRDPGVYLITTHWLASHGGLATTGGLIGGGAPGPITAASPGFYLQGDTVVPQFMSGTATALLPGGWLAGWAGIGVLLAVYAAAGLLAVAGLVARLVGPRWAPVAALALGLSLPQLLTARTALSEPISQLLLFGALCLLLDAIGDGTGGLSRQSGRAGAALAGLLLGLGPLVRFDFVRELLLLIPVLGWLAARRRPEWLWVAGGVLTGGAFAAVDAFGPSRSYVVAVLYLLRPVAVGGPLLLLTTAGAVALIRRRGVPARLRRRLAVAGAVAVVAAAGFLSLRPWLHIARQPVDDSTPILAGLQRDQQLPVDGTRTYAEQSLRWLSWYVGWPAIALAVAAAAALAWAALRGVANRWALALPVPLASAVLVLYRPAITPDHPWADRRLVPTVLPVAVLLAVAAVAWLTRAARGRAARGRAARGRAARGRATPGQAAGGGWLAGRWLAGTVTAVVGVTGLVVPAALATAPMLTARTELGESAAVDTACAAFGPGDVALAVDARTRQELIPALRLVCEVPTYAVPGEPGDATATPAELAAAVSEVRAAGGHPVLVAQSAEPLPKLSRTPQRQVAALDTTEQQRLLDRPPTRLAPLRVEIWVAPAD
ncbi:MAG: hypothetical protein V7637_6379 [Mycobacteriales bacterium]